MFGLEMLVTLLAPHDCLICGDEGALLCGSCMPSTIISASGNCFRCQAPKTNELDTSICSQCQADTGLDRVWVAVKYSGVVQDLIKHFKFERAKDAAGQLANMLYEALPRAPTGVISYIPTATSRIRERGYDHAQQLCIQYGRLQGRKIYPVLARLGQARQVGASRGQRLTQLETAFIVKNRQLVAERDVLLIDDVVTTGATLQAAAQVLKKAGAQYVSALIVAQKQ